MYNNNDTGYIRCAKIEHKHNIRFKNAVRVSGKTVSNFIREAIKRYADELEAEKGFK